MDKKVRVYALGIGPSLKHMPKWTLNDATDSVFSVALSADSKFLASGSGDKKVRLYTVGDLREPPCLAHTLDDATARVESLASFEKFSSPPTGPP